MHKKLFVYNRSKKTKEGILQDIYLPKQDLYIKGINRNNYPFEVKKYKVKELSVHHGTDLWLIELKNNMVIKVSGDHSIIVKKDQELLDIKPSKLLHMTLSDKNKDATLIILENNMQKEVPIYDVITCKKIEENTVTYDFSLEGTDTFFANNILVMDTVTVFMPQTEESQNEVRKMFEKVFLPQTNDFKYEVTWDTVYGLYKLTKNSSQNLFVDKNNILQDYKELEKYLIQNPDKTSLQVSVKLKNKKINISLGRYLVNLLIPNFSSVILDDVLNKENIMKLLNTVAKEELEKREQVDDSITFYDSLCKLGNKFATIYPINFNLDMTQELDKKIEPYISKIQKMKLLEGMKSIEKALEVTKKFLEKENPELYESIDSGARGNWSDIQQLFVTKGYVTDVDGRIISQPIKNSLVKSLNKDEFFTAAYGSRKGIVDRALNTAEPGYLLRQLCIANSSIVLGENDCGTKDGFKIKITETNYKKFYGRYTVKNELLTPENIKNYIGKEIVIRSPMYCESKNNTICKKCFGSDHNLHKSKYIGMLASQSLGERLQQTMLKNFHTGGIAKLNEIPQIIPKDITLIQQVEDVIKTNIKETSFKVYIKDDETEYHIVQSSMLIKKGTIYLSSANKEEKFSFNHDFILIELYPDTITRLEFEETNEKGNVLYFTRKQDALGKLVFKIEDISTSIKYIKKFFSGNIDYVTIEDIYDSINKYLYSYNINSIVLEVILSNMIRCQNDSTKLWRNNKNEKIKLVSLKQIPSLTSSILAIGFEDVGNSIINGLVKESSSENILEKILKGRIEDI